MVGRSWTFNVFTHKKQTTQTICLCVTYYLFSLFVFSSSFLLKRIYAYITGGQHQVYFVLSVSICCIIVGQEQKKHSTPKKKMSTSETKYFHTSLESSRPCKTGPGHMFGRAQGASSVQILVDLGVRMKNFHTRYKFFHRSRKGMKHFKTSKEIIGAKHFHTYFGFHSYISLLVWKLFITFGTVYLTGTVWPVKNKNTVCV